MIQDMDFEPPPAWVGAAVCGALPTHEAEELFFPRVGEIPRRARELCALCPVRRECLDAALARKEPVGVWGGTSERQRLKLRRALTHAPSR